MYHQEGAMVKTSRIQKIAGKTKKKEVKKKAAAIPVSPKKTTAKKKQSGKVASKIKGKKTQVKQRKSKIQTQKKVKKTVVKSETPAKKPGPKRTIKKTTAKALLKTSIKIKPPQKADKPPKTIKGKTIAKGGREEKATPLTKTTKKITEKPQKKITTEKAVKPKASKLRKTLSKKRAAPLSKKKKPAKIKTLEKIDQKKSVKKTRPAKKRTPKKITEGKQIKKAEILSEAEKVQIVPELKDIRGVTLKTGYRPVDVTIPPALLETLPSEYGENGITVMPVNPYKLFAFWEIRQETLDIFKGSLNLRVYDVTGIDFETTDAHSFIDTEVNERVGKMYLDVSPSKEYIADIGIVYNGIFIGIARSPRVSTPGAGVPGEEEFLPKGFDFGIRTGY
jgi:hypothetical protein